MAELFGLYTNQNHNISELCDLIQAGARFELEEIDGKAALFFAAKNDYGMVVHKLHSKGLDVNIIDDEGKNAVFYANQAGARFVLKEIDGKAALFFAAKKGYSRVVDKLVSKGLDANITDGKEKLPCFMLIRITISLHFAT